MICTAKALRITINQESFLSFIHFDTPTAGTVCLPALAQIFMLVQLTLDKLVEDVGMVGAIAVPADDDHFSNIFVKFNFGHQADLNILKDTISVEVNRRNKLPESLHLVNINTELYLINYYL